VSDAPTLTQCSGGPCGGPPLAPRPNTPSRRRSRYRHLRIIRTPHLTKSLRWASRESPNRASHRGSRPANRPVVRPRAGLGWPTAIAGTADHCRKGLTPWKSPAHPDAVRLGREEGLNQFHNFELAHGPNVGCALQWLQFTPCGVDGDNVQLTSHSPRNTSRVLRPAPSTTFESCRSSVHGSKYAASQSLQWTIRGESDTALALEPGPCTGVTVSAACAEALGTASGTRSVGCGPRWPSRSPAAAVKPARRPGTTTLQPETWAMSPLQSRWRT